MLNEPSQQLLPLVLLLPQVVPNIFLSRERPLCSLFGCQLLSLALPVLELVDDVCAELRQTSHVVDCVFDIDAEVVLGVERSLLIVKGCVRVVVTLLGLVGVETSFGVSALERLRDSPIASD